MKQRERQTQSYPKNKVTNITRTGKEKLKSPGKLLNVSSKIIDSITSS